MHPILIVGDPHGDFNSVRAACAHAEPGTLILVGDQNLERPLRQELADVFAAGWDVRWIHGNHDSDSTAWHDHLFVDYPAGNLGGKVIEIGGIRIGGLGGVFRGKIWDGAGKSAFRKRRDYLRSLKAPARWRTGLPLRQRATIFPEDFDFLAAQRCDVLVTHEAPSTHEHGFTVLDELAAAMGAQLIVHGHHHRSYAAVAQSGLRVRGLGIGEVWQLEL